MVLKNQYLDFILNLLDKVDSLGSLLLSTLLLLDHLLLAQDDLDEELELFLELLREEAGSDKVLTNSVHLGFHLEVRVLDTHLVPLVQQLEDFEALQRLLGNILVNLRHFTVKDNSNLLELAEELWLCPQALAAHFLCLICLRRAPRPPRLQLLSPMCG